MIILNKNNKFYLYFDSVENKNLFGIFNTLSIAKCRARKLLKLHNGNMKNIAVI